MISDSLIDFAHSVSSSSTASIPPKVGGNRFPGSIRGNRLARIWTAFLSVDWHATGLFIVRCAFSLALSSGGVVA